MAPRPHRRPTAGRPCDPSHRRGRLHPAKPRRTMPSHSSPAYPLHSARLPPPYSKQRHLPPLPPPPPPAAPQSTTPADRWGDQMDGLLRLCNTQEKADLLTIWSTIASLSKDRARTAMESACKAAAERTRFRALCNPESIAVMVLALAFYTEHPERVRDALQAPHRRPNYPSPRRTTMHPKDSKHSGGKPLACSSALDPTWFLPPHRHQHSGREGRRHPGHQERMAIPSDIPPQGQMKHILRRLPLPPASIAG